MVVWVNSFSYCAHLDVAMDHMYSEVGTEQVDKDKHKKEGESRRRLDETDRENITLELGKYSHPLSYQHGDVLAPEGCHRKREGNLRH